MLQTLDEKNPRRIFEGEALLRRMNRYGLLAEFLTITNRFSKDDSQPHESLSQTQDESLSQTQDKPYALIPRRK
jgi:hypothetical protein